MSVLGSNLFPVINDAISLRVGRDGNEDDDEIGLFGYWRPLALRNGPLPTLGCRRGNFDIDDDVVDEGGLIDRRSARKREGEEEAAVVAQQDRDDIVLLGANGEEEWEGFLS